MSKRKKRPWGRFFLLDAVGLLHLLTGDGVEVTITEDEELTVMDELKGLTLSGFDQFFQR